MMAIWCNQNTYKNGAKQKKLTILARNKWHILDVYTLGFHNYLWALKKRIHLRNRRMQQLKEQLFFSIISEVISILYFYILPWSVNFVILDNSFIYWLEMVLFGLCRPFNETSI